MVGPSSCIAGLDVSGPRRDAEADIDRASRSPVVVGASVWDAVGLKLVSDMLYAQLIMLSSLSSSSPGIPAVCGDAVPASIIFNCSTEAMPALLEAESDGDSLLAALDFRNLDTDVNRSPWVCEVCGRGLFWFW